MKELKTKHSNKSAYISTKNGRILTSNDLIPKFNERRKRKLVKQTKELEEELKKRKMDLLTLEEEIEKQNNSSQSSILPLPVPPTLTLPNIIAPPILALPAPPPYSSPDEIIAYTFPPTSNEVKLGKVVKKDDNGLLIHPASKKERMKKGNKYFSYFFEEQVEKITIGLSSFILNIKLNADGALCKKSTSELNLVLNGKTLD